MEQLQNYVNHVIINIVQIVLVVYGGILMEMKTASTATTATIMNEFLQFAMKELSLATTHQKSYIVEQVDFLIKKAENDSYLANNEKFMQVARSLNEQLTLEELMNICIQLPKLQTEYGKWLANQEL